LVIIYNYTRDTRGTRKSSLL